MKRLKKLVLALLVLLLSGLAVLLFLVKAPVDPPLQAPSSFATRPQGPRKLPKLDIAILDTGYTRVPEALVVSGGKWGVTKRYRHSVFLIRHPSGTILFDGGLGSSIDTDFATVPWYQRIKPYQKEKSLKELVERISLEGKISFFMLSHAHWDHVSGMLDFPEVPIMLLPEEAAFLKNPDSHFRRGVFPSQVNQIQNRLQEITLEDKPYENFPKSLDFFRDQSLVVVSLSGHTPGSLGLFVNLPDGNRFFLVGDAVHGIHPDGSPEARTRLMELMSDYDPTQARIMRGKLTELIAHSNEVKLVPTHEPDLLEKYLKAGGEPSPALRAPSP